MSRKPVTITDRLISPVVGMFVPRVEGDGLKTGFCGDDKGISRPASPSDDSGGSKPHMIQTRGGSKWVSGKKRGPGGRSVGRCFRGVIKILDVVTIATARRKDDHKTYWERGGEYREDGADLRFQGALLRVMWMII